MEAFNFETWEDSDLLDWLDRYQDQASLQSQIARADQEVMARAVRFDGTPSDLSVRAIVAQYHSDPAGLTGSITWLGWVV